MSQQRHHYSRRHETPPVYTRYTPAGRGPCPPYVRYRRVPVHDQASTTPYVFRRADDPEAATRRILADVSQQTTELFAGHGLQRERDFLAEEEDRQVPSIFFRQEEMHELGDSASWTLSTAKTGNGIEQIRDNDVDTFWQSDGPQPHLISIQFFRKAKISEIQIYFSYKLDESYTPSVMALKIGPNMDELREIQVVELKEPDGWVSIPLALPQNLVHQFDEKSNDQTSFTSAAAEYFKEVQPSCRFHNPNFGGAVDFVRTFCVQIVILTNHQNGRDTHLRQIRLVGPKDEDLCESLNRVADLGVYEKTDENTREVRELKHSPRREPLLNQFTILR